MSLTYALVAIFLLTGDSFIERRGLTLQQCATYAATARMESERLHGAIGEVDYMCVPEGVQ